MDHQLDSSRAWRGFRGWMHVGLSVSAVSKGALHSAAGSFLAVAVSYYQPRYGPATGPWAALQMTVGAACGSMQKLTSHNPRISDALRHLDVSQEAIPCHEKLV